MRDGASYSESLFTAVRLAQFLRALHPLRRIGPWLNDALAPMDAKFSALNEAADLER